MTIAAWACLLLLHRDTNYYPRLITILVYPNAYIARNLEHKGGGVVEEEEAVRIGEAWMDGVAVISWDDVCRSAVGVGDFANVVLHEFAHLLDFEDGLADGTPRQPIAPITSPGLASSMRNTTSWRRDAALGRGTALDHYGATNPAEFFAVATEKFLRKARRAAAKTSGTLHGAQDLLPARSGRAHRCRSSRVQDCRLTACYSGLRLHFRTRSSTRTQSCGEGTEGVLYWSVVNRVTLVW